MEIKSDHAILLNALDEMASSPYYALRHRILRAAEELILAQEKRIKELEANNNKESHHVHGR